MNKALPEITDEVVEYVQSYGGMCRDCADDKKLVYVCSKDGLPCRDSAKSIRHVLKAFKYGAENGFIAPAQPPADDQPFPPGSRARAVLLQASLLIGELSKGLEKGDPTWEELQKFGRDFDAAMTGDDQARRDALEWYAIEAEAIAKNLAIKNDAALLASVQVLALDGGKRARNAIDTAQAASAAEGKR